MEFKKGMKKALSVLLSLSMVVTGVTVGGKEAKADGEKEYLLDIAPAYTTTDNGTVTNHYDYTGAVQEGTVTVTGTVTDGDGEGLYGKIRLTSTNTDFIGTVDYVRNGSFSATVDISQVEMFAVVPVKVEFLENNEVKATNNEVTIKVQSNDGIKLSWDAVADNAQASATKAISKKTGLATDVTMTLENIFDKYDYDAYVDEDGNDVPAGTANNGVMYAKLKLEDMSVANSTAESAAAVIEKMKVSSVKFDDNELVDETSDKYLENDLVTGKEKFVGVDTTTATVELINRYNTNALVTLSSYASWNVGYDEVKALFDDSLDSHSITVTFTYEGDDTAEDIAPAAEPTTPVDVTDQPDPVPSPDDSDAPASSDPATSNGPAESTAPTSGSAVTATVTAVAMAPQAMTATAGSVTTMAAVLTVTGSSLDLLKVNNTVAANNATVSAVSTSGITVALTAPANVTSKSAAATFAAVVTVPASVATGEYALTASVGAVKANVATVSVIAAGTGETPVEDVHTTKLKIKTANGTNKSAVMGVGETAKLKVVKTPADSVDAVTAVSAKAKVVKASVNKAGKLVLKAKKAGTAKVTVTSGEVSKKITVTVKKAPKKLTLKDGKKAAKKTVKLAASTKKKAVKKTYKITLPKNTASYDYTVKKTGKVVKSAVVKTNKKNVQTLVVTVKKKAKGSGKIVITSNANKKAKATVKVKAK